MGKQSGFLRRVQENQRQNMHLQRLFTIQQCEDMALITLGQDFGFGEKRATEFLEKYRETFEAYASLCLENAKGDANMDYTKGCIDRELARIMGSAFQPWEVRYPEKVFGGKSSLWKLKAIVISATALCLRPSGARRCGVSPCLARRKRMLTTVPWSACIVTAARPLSR